MNNPQLQSYRTIERVVERMRPLADWMTINKPSQTTLTLFRADFDLLVGHPEAARRLGIVIIDGCVRYRSFKLKPDERSLAEPLRPARQLSID